MVTVNILGTEYKVIMSHSKIKMAMVIVTIHQEKLKSEMIT